MSIDFGDVDPAAFILALIAAFIGLEAMLSPLRRHVQKPRHAYTTFYRESMLFADDSETPSNHDWILSLAVSRTAFMGLWSWTNWHGYILLDTPVGLGQWLLYPVSQTGSGILTALLLMLVTPFWCIKMAYVRFMLLRVANHDTSSPRKRRWKLMGSVFHLDIETPQSFHLQVLGNSMKVLHRMEDVFGHATESVFSRLALTKVFPLGAGTLAFSRVGSGGGIWIGVFYDLAKKGYLESNEGDRHVMAGNIRLTLKKNSFIVNIHGLKATAGISSSSEHGDVGQMVRILISHGISDPVDRLISLWGISAHQLYQVRFTHMILQQEKAKDRGFMEKTNHWVNKRIRLSKKLTALASMSPWCHCSDFYCFCSLRGIMFTPPLKHYHHTRGIILTNDVTRAAANVLIQTAGAIALADKSPWELSYDVSLALVDRHTKYNRVSSHLVVQID